MRFTKRIVGGRQLALAAPLVALVAAAACTDPVTAPRQATASAVAGPAHDLALTSGGVYYVHNACGDKLLDVPSASASDGQPLQTWTRWGGANQQWKLTTTSDSGYQITSVSSGKVVDVYGWATANGSAVVQYAVTGYANQHWRVTDLGTGYAKLNPMHALGKALDVQGASTADGARVQIWDDNGSCAQQWKFEPVAGSVTPPARWTLTWSDEFDGAAGSAPDASRWTNDVGGSGWGNNELEYYTPGGHNASLDGAGHLVIEARREAFGGREFTSARLLTQGRFTQTYGRFEARLKVPTGSGIWPAFWMLGANIDTVGWPNSGELDIMELVGTQPSTVYGTAHAGGPGGYWQNGGGDTLHTGTYGDAYHVYAVEWSPDTVRWYVDSTLYHTMTRSQLTGAQTWAFDHPFFMILNVAVGGNWPGAPGPTATFPQRMYADYVRVYRAGP